MTEERTITPLHVESDNQAKARAILGNRYYGFRETVDALRLQVTPKELEALENVPFEDRALEQCWSGHVLVPCFPTTVLHILDKMPDLFNRESLSFFNWVFATMSLQAKWLLIRTDPLPGTGKLNVPYSTMCGMLGADEIVPWLSEAVYALILCKILDGRFPSTGFGMYCRETFGDEHGDQQRSILIVKENQLALCCAGQPLDVPLGLASRKLAIGESK